MPMNQFSSDMPEAVWWSHQSLMEPTPSSKHKPLISTSQFYDHHRRRAASAATPAVFCGQNTALSFNLNQEDDEEVQEEQLTDERGQLEADKEPMFEKPLTPSDVGKLNRLVIPKQHAEKYFPLGGGGDAGDKGFLLSFEDESGKCWRFRYSYWNSSQSYVLTKGWSRYVKEKRLDAGDVVLFERHRIDGDRLFIGWRRRSPARQDGRVTQPPAVAVAASNGREVKNQTGPSGNSKRLRLFGVNLDCHPEGSEPSTPDGSSISSQGPTQGHFHYFANALASNSQTEMDCNFTRDVNQMGYRQG